MNKTSALFLGIIFTAIIGFLSYKSTFALFSDTTTSTNNVFSTAAEFPPQTNHVVISEVQVKGALHAEDDFVELYNPTGTQFNLSGHRLVKRLKNSSVDVTLKSWTSDAFIPAHGFYLWANSDHGFAASINADTSTTLSITKDNSIALRLGAENTGTTIDALSWDSSINSLKEGTEFGTSNPSDNQSIERKALSTSTASTMAIGGADEFKGNGYDTNNNATDFVLRTVSQPQNSSSGTEIP